MAIPHELPLISTLAVGFSVAFACGMLAVKLRLSPIVGYLLAGIIVGPFTPGFVADEHIAEQVAEMGILMLMFGVGLHFSLSDLMDVRRIALPGAIVQIMSATIMGAAVSYFWDWPLTSGLMLGLALSVASTVVLLRTLESKGMMQSTNANIAIGWLLVEDIIMVLALVLIPALAGMDEKQGMSGMYRELGIALGKIVLFIAFMIVAGKRILPWLLMVVARTRSRELFTLGVFAVAMGVAFGASKLFGVSFALGAFFAGMMIRESDLSHEAAEKALPLQDAFAVLFFVSVGMLFNPEIIWEEPLKVLAVLGIIVIGKSAAAAAIILVFRYPLKTALIVSAGLAQIGEFSFILAGLGVAYGLMPEMGRDLILAGAIISIALNPFFFYTSKIIYEYVLGNPRLSRFFKIGDDLIQLSEEARNKLKDLVIMVGHGRVGRHISANIQSAKIDLVVVDSNRERIEDLREQGFNAIAGDATYEETLREASIGSAMALIVAVPNSYEARKIVETARAMRPDIKILVRAHNDAEMEYFASQKVDLAVMGPREVGRRMVEYLGGLREKPDLV